MRRNDFEISNRVAARIILSNPDKFEGLALMWARCWVEKQERIKAGMKNYVLTRKGASSATGPVGSQDSIRSRSTA